MLLSELHSPIQVLQHLCPIATTLATDRVADVRTVTFKLVSARSSCRLTREWERRTSINESINESINQSINQASKQASKQSINQSIGACNSSQKWV